LKPQKPTISSKYLELLGEFEAICETAFARESGPWGGLINEKKRAKNLVTLPL
jgi:hypothetical protein